VERVIGVTIVQRAFIPVSEENPSVPKMALDIGFHLKARLVKYIFPARNFSLARRLLL